MGEFYGKKIVNHELNSKGELWTLKLVPSLWRKKTEAWLAAYEANKEN